MTLIGPADGYFDIVTAASQQAPVRRTGSWLKPVLSAVSIVVLTRLAALPADGAHGKARARSQLQPAAHRLD